MMEGRITRSKSGLIQEENDGMEGEICEIWEREVVEKMGGESQMGIESEFRVIIMENEKENQSGREFRSSGEMQIERDSESEVRMVERQDLGQREIAEKGKSPGGSQFDLQSLGQLIQSLVAQVDDMRTENQNSKKEIFTQMNHLNVDLTRKIDSTNIIIQNLNHKIDSNNIEIKNLKINHDLAIQNLSELINNSNTKIENLEKGHQKSIQELRTKLNTKVDKVQNEIYEKLSAEKEQLSANVNQIDQDFKNHSKQRQVYMENRIERNFDELKIELDTQMLKQKTQFEAKISEQDELIKVLKESTKKTILCPINYPFYSNFQNSNGGTILKFDQDRDKCPKRFFKELKKEWEQFQGFVSINEFIKKHVTPNIHGWIDTQDPDHQTIETWEELFLKRFWSTDTQFKVQQSIITGKYNQKEYRKPVEYLIYWYNLGRDLSFQFTEEEIIRYLSRHFSNQVVSAVKCRGVSTLSDMINLLEEYDVSEIVGENYRTPRYASNSDKFQNVDRQNQNFNKQNQNFPQHFNNQYQSNFRENFRSNNQNPNSNSHQYNLGKKSQGEVKNDRYINEIQIESEEPKDSPPGNRKRTWYNRNYRHNQPSYSTNVESPGEEEQSYVEGSSLKTTINPYQQTNSNDHFLGN